MADAYTDTATTNLVVGAYQLAIHLPLRNELYYDPWATVRMTPVSTPGTSITYHFKRDLAIADTPLTETVDVDAVEASVTTGSVTITEYGNAMLTTLKLRQTSSIVPVDPMVAETIGRNAGETIDRLARKAIEGTSNVSTVNDVAASAIATSDTLSADEVRQRLADFRSANVRPVMGDGYVWVMHPHVSYDLQSDVGTAGTNWGYADASIRGTIGDIPNGLVSKLGGFYFIETPNVSVAADEGASAVDNYCNYLLGAEGLIKVWGERGGSPNPQVVLGPVTDKLRRFQPIGWYWLGGYGRFRPEAVRMVKCASSLGANA